MLASDTFVFGTKAETLERLQPFIKTATIPGFFYFPAAIWRSSPDSILQAITKRLGPGQLAVRSSALAEDGSDRSMAGAFLSRLNVKGSDRSALTQAIDQVVRSLTGRPGDQVLVQLMIEDVAMSGVIMTYDMVHGAPYYCIDYDDETGRTDIVTSGNGINKGLFVYRDADDSMIRSPRIAAFLRLARELEAICGYAALDIEFGMNRAGHLFLFQVRRIVLSRTWHPVIERRVKRQLVFVEKFVRDCSLRREGVLGDRTVLAVMPDWNPAEIIGTTPRQLAASLYRELITNGIWCEARAAMGYRSLVDADLMLLINNHPYIDVRNSFNSFVPAAVPDPLGNKLVNAWLDRLEAHPELHDKVEFDVVPTCVDFCFQEDMNARYPGLLDDTEFVLFRDALTSLTRDCLASAPAGTLDRALDDAGVLERLRLMDTTSGGHIDLVRAAFLLRHCRKFGTLPFAVVARHAFIAESLLRSAARRGALTDGRLSEFRRSIRTVTGNMVTEYAQVCRGTRDRSQFLAKYGHLRPGTYEITSLRYDERPDLFLEEMPAISPIEVPKFSLTQGERVALDSLLGEAGLDVLNADQLVMYASRAIAGREQVKFVFTRALSDALSALVHWGEAHGLSRDDLSYLDWSLIAGSLTHPVMDHVDRYYLEFAEAGRRSISAAHGFRLGHIIFGVRDIYVATLNRSVPNFVGIGAITGRVVELGADTPASVDIKDRVVCVDNADPGFDWIFTKGPKALITKFGGANSHMAIRCAELGLPAAIGCGEQIFSRVVAAGSVELNCTARILRPIQGE
jgi:hypothetical protein